MVPGASVLRVTGSGVVAGTKDVPGVTGSKSNLA